jgi:hypothetical protein
MASGYTATLPSDVLLDSGLLYIANTLVGASRGGIKFHPNKEWRNVVFDGKRSDIVGLDRVVKFGPVLEGTLIVINATSLLLYEPGAASATVGSVTTITPAKASSLIAAASLITNLRALYPRGGGGFCEVAFPKAICTQWGLEGTDNEEVGVPFQFGARLDMSVGGATTDDAPYKIRLITAVTD